MALRQAHDDPATTPSFVAVRFTPLPSPHPGRKTRRRRERGLLAFRVAAFIHLPKRFVGAQWFIERSLAGYSCGGSRGLKPRSLTLVPGAETAL